MFVPTCVDFSFPPLLTLVPATLVPHPKKLSPFLVVVVMCVVLVVEDVVVTVVENFVVTTNVVFALMVDDLNGKVAAEIIAELIVDVVVGQHDGLFADPKIKN